MRRRVTRLLCICRVDSIMREKILAMWSTWFFPTAFILFVIFVRGSKFSLQNKQDLSKALSYAISAIDRTGLFHSKQRREIWNPPPPQLTCIPALKVSVVKLASLGNAKVCFKGMSVLVTNDNPLYLLGIWGVKLSHLHLAGIWNIWLSFYFLHFYFKCRASLMQQFPNYGSVTHQWVTIQLLVSHKTDRVD